MSPAPKGETEGTRSRSVVQRTAQVMDAFTTRQRWGVRELATYLAVPKSGLHRTLQEMAAEGLLTADEDGTYAISAQMLRLASGLIQSADLTRVAHEHLTKARNATGETALLTVYDSARQQVIAVDMVPSVHPIQFMWGALRDWTDLHLSASGRGILAFLPAPELVDYFSKPRTSTQGERVTLTSLEPSLRRIRETGWALTHGERVAGSTGVCAPIFDGRERIAGGVVIVWPDRPEPMDEKFIGSTCSATARAISADLGWHP